MSKWKAEAIKRYKEECFKQTRPYQFEVACIDDEGEVPNGNSPLSAKGTIIYFPDADRNVMNFEGINTEYLVFVCKDGVASPDLVSRLIEKGAGADIIYPDEDFITDVNGNLEDPNQRIRLLRTPWRKPDYSPDTLLSFPYVETCFAIRTAFARMVPAIKKSAEISDKVRIWDFILRATERTNRITHVSEILYHRDLKAYAIDKDIIADEDIYEALKGEYSKAGYQLCKEAAEKRRGLKEEVWREIEGPVVSIIIPSKDNPEMLKDCIRSIRMNAGNTKYEIIVVDNGSEGENLAKIERMIDNLPTGLATYIYEPFEFDFSRMCNIGANAAKAPFLLFLNDDIDVTTDRFMDMLLKYACLNHVGAVGAKLLYPEDDKIQHVGVTNINKGPTHKLVTKSDKTTHYYCRNLYAWDVLAVTGACLMIAREKYFQVGGFSDKMKVGYNDVDLCVKLVECGYFNIVNNNCVLIHRESISRGSDALSQEKMDRLKRERESFYEVHQWLLTRSDPFYNQYLDMDTIEIKSSIVADYQMTDMRNKVSKLNRLPARVSDKVKFSIDRTSFEWGIRKDASDAYVYDGWALFDKKDNALFKKYLILVRLDEEDNLTKECLIATVSPKYRPDLADVFVDAENVYLSGFECRIPADKLDEGGRYRIGMCLKKLGGTKNIKISLGDLYEPGRGIITEN